MTRPKKKRRSQHAKGQAGSELKVNQVPTTREEEDRTEVLQEEEEGIIKNPAAEGTGISYETRPSQSTIKPHYHSQDFPNHIHKNFNSVFLEIFCAMVKNN